MHAKSGGGTRWRGYKACTPRSARRSSIASVPARAELPATPGASAHGHRGDPATPRSTALEKHRFVLRESSPLHSRHALPGHRDAGASSGATNHLFVNSRQRLPALSCFSRFPGEGTANLRARGMILWIAGSQLR